MSDQLKYSIIRIQDSGRKIVGSGFLVADRLVITCAHVVVSALTLGNIPTDTPLNDLTLDFPLVASGNLLTARIVAWQPKTDVAVLELRGVVPSGIIPARLSHAGDLWGHDFRVFGFPSGFDDGVWADGRILGPQATGWLQIEDVKQTGYFVQPGFSGGPVWDAQLSGVVGMTVAADTRQAVRAAFILPVTALVEAWPSLAANVQVVGTDTSLRTYYPTASIPRAKSIVGRKRIFLSYQRGAQPDETLALHLYAALNQQHEVFIDQKMTVGTSWQARIQAELEGCDFLIPLLSAESVHSEMVEYEVSTAHHIRQKRGSKPTILPVRVAFTQPFDYPLNAYLNHLNWATWYSERDTPRLLVELSTALSGGELSLMSVLEKAAALRAHPVKDLPRPRAFANPVPLERPDGTMDPESKFYVQRLGDAICRRELERQGVTVAIKAPRQVGKSSLLIRTAEQAAQNGREVAFLDFQLLDERMLLDPDAFFQGFCHWIADELDLEDTVETFWSDGLGNVQLCTKYVRHHILKPLERPLMLAMDEVDRMLGCPFRSDFFGMLRAWHNSRRTGNVWQKLDLLLVISTEPYLLIDDLKQSPFNVGEVIRLEDFTPQQVADLNVRHGTPFTGLQLDRLTVLLGGHPYLIRQAMYRVASRETEIETLLANAAKDDGPFGDHLQRHLARFPERPELVHAMRQIIRHHTCPDHTQFYRLHGAGLVRREGDAVVPRCGVYADYFRERLSA
jgi:hypothetical protein